MKVWIKIVFIAGCLLFISFVSLYLFIIFAGKSLLTEKLKSATGRQVTVGSFDISVPLTVHISDLDMQGLGRVDAVHISPSIWRLFLGSIVFDRVVLTRPRFFLEVGKSVVGGHGQEPAVSGGERGSVSAAPTLFSGNKSVVVLKKSLSWLRRRLEPQMHFERIIVTGGEVQYTDHRVGKQGITLRVQDIAIAFDHFYFPFRDVVTSVDISGVVPWTQAEDNPAGKIRVKGWVNLLKRDMDATIEIRDIDGVYLYPYYASWVDIEKAHIEKARLQFNSDLKASDNKLTAVSHLELTDITFRSRANEDQNQKPERVASAVSDMVKTLNEGKVVLDFIIRTRLDRPELRFGDMNMAFEDTRTKGKESMPGFRSDSFLSKPVRIWRETFVSLGNAAKGMSEPFVCVAGQVRAWVIRTYHRLNKKNASVFVPGKGGA